MVNFTIKNIPDSVYQALQQSAEANNHTINDELLEIISSATNEGTQGVEAVIRAARQLRKLTAGFPIDDDTLTMMKNDGRLRN